MNQYNPKIHHRRSIRLKGYDYSKEGSYFITICCQDRICRFGQVENGEMVLNELGLEAYNEWTKLTERFPNMEMDVFQIMPNHMHGIVVLGGATLAVAPGAEASPAPSVSDIIGAYKSLVANRCLDIYKTKNKILGKLWQRNFYEHIIRDVQSYQRISEYILNNPKKWANDNFYRK